MPKRKHRSCWGALPTAALLLTCLGVVSALGDAAALNDVHRDLVLRKVRQALPPGWRMRVTATQITVERTKPVWVLMQNNISAPRRFETADARAKRIMLSGQQQRPQILFRAVPRWSVHRLTLARTNNRQVGEQIKRLAIKYRLEALLRRPFKPPLITAARTPDERARVVAYEAALAKLRRQRITLPSYHTQRLSLFFPQYRGWSDAYHIVHPSKVAEACYRLDYKLRAMLVSIPP